MTERLVRAGVDKLEPGREIDVPGCGEWVVGPQHQTLVPGVTGELDARVDQLPAESVATRVWVDEQDAQLRRRVVLTYAEDAAGSAAVYFGDPGRLTQRVVLARVVGDDSRDECLERGVPTE